MQLKAQIKRLALASHVPAQAILQNFMLERYCKENYYARGIEFDEVIEILMNT